MQIANRKYGVAQTINFPLYQVDGVDMEVAATFAAGDLVVVKDEGAPANTTNLPTDEGSGYSLVLTATEMQAARIQVYVIDQTATKIWLDVCLALETYGNASAQHAFDLGTASTPQTADHTAGIADIPTVSEFNARTILAAEYFDPAADTVANVTTVATTTTNTDMRGTDAGATAANLATVDANVDAILVDTGTTLPASLADIPTVAEFNARTLVAAAYFDPAADAVALVSTVTTNTDMRGTDSAATAANLATVDANVDAILVDTGTTLPASLANIPTVSEFNARTLLAASYFDPATDDVAVVTLVNTTTTNTDMRGTDSAATAANLATVDGIVDAILVDTGTTLPAQLDSMAGATFVTGTDSLEAIRNRGDAAWTTGAGGTPPQLLQATTIATLASQTSFTLTAGSADNDAYNGAVVVITDSVTAEQKAVGAVSDYTGASKTITLSADPAIFTMAAGDTVEIIAALGSGGTGLDAAATRAALGLASANLDTQLADVPTVAELNARTLATADYFDPAADAVALVATVTTNTDMRGTDSAATAANLATVDANVDAILADTGTTLPASLAAMPTTTELNARTILAAGYALEATVNALGVLVADVPTVAELTARTLLAAEYFDPAADAVALVATVTTNTDMRGTDSAATAANLATVDANVDTINTNTARMLAGTVQKNAALPNFPFLMVDSTDHTTPVTGLTVTAQRNIDGGGFSAATGTVVEIGGGFYEIGLLAADTNGDSITYRFSAAGADDADVSVLTT